jgi:hypothetical protein
MPTGIPIGKGVLSDGQIESEKIQSGDVRSDEKISHCIVPG